jgi:Myristoyl-CoA:protein N-myristoyltransferase, C-terminal domain
MAQARMTMARTIKLYKLPEETATPGIRPMHQADVPQVGASRQPSALCDSPMQPGALMMHAAMGFMCLGPVAVVQSEEDDRARAWQYAQGVRHPAAVLPNDSHSPDSLCKDSNVYCR